MSNLKGGKKKVLEGYIDKSLYISKLFVWWGVFYKILANRITVFKKKSNMHTKKIRITIEEIKDGE
jgi:hypothetical protein